MSNQMRWIHHRPDGGVTCGEVAPDTGGDLHFVDQAGNSLAVVGGKVYVNGRLAAPGQRYVQLKSGRLPIAVGAGGKAVIKPFEPGGAPGGPR